MGNKIIDYIVGNLRYKLYYSNFCFLMRNHIFEQIVYRINSMDTECYKEGSCKLCGCSTTALQMCSRACDKPCYPAMVNKIGWENWKESGMQGKDEEGRMWLLDKTNEKIILVK